MKLIHERIICHHGRDVIPASLKGVIGPDGIDMIERLREEVDLAEKHKEKCQAWMLEICKEKFPEALERLQDHTRNKGTFGHIIDRRDRNGCGQVRNRQPPFIMERSETEERRIQQENQITEHHPTEMCISARPS